MKREKKKRHRPEKLLVEFRIADVTRRTSGYSSYLALHSISFIVWAAASLHPLYLVLHKLNCNYFIIPMVGGEKAEAKQEDHNLHRDIGSSEELKEQVNRHRKALLWTGEPISQ